MSNLYFPFWARVLRFLLAPVILQPLMIVLIALLIWLLRPQGTFTSFMWRAWLLFAVGLVWLYLGRRAWWRRPYLVQMPIGFVLAPAYIYALLVVLFRNL
jgi:hypothetical protein